MGSRDEAKHVDTGNQNEIRGRKSAGSWSMLRKARKVRSRGNVVMRLPMKERSERSDVMCAKGMERQPRKKEKKQEKNRSDLRLSCP